MRMSTYIMMFLALCEVFDKADVTRDGTISIPEYVSLCQEYGIELTDEDIHAVENLADEDGEVRRAAFKRLKSTATRFFEGSQGRLHSSYQAIQSIEGV